ncbi:MAG: hypothetical protein LLG06_15035 [Desulfobacteraceae bacterium]|nr:hypothetical protein [Desulfobacteraceae bacterium]
MDAKPNDSGESRAWDGLPVAVFWDQSLAWGLLCIRELSRRGVPFRLLRASDICRGGLEPFRVLLVPGGWAAHKVRVLGETGRKCLSGFIFRGGSYIGFCGGAGLALSSPPALKLTGIERMPLAERLPSASGGVMVEGTLSHPAWKDLPPSIPVSVWWPSQFRWDAGCDAAPVAVYADPADDFQVADLRVRDLGRNVCWADLESTYGINLNPARIKGHPAIIEVPEGKGRLVLSYAHLETPGDSAGNRLFLNLLRYLDASSAGSESAGGAPGSHPEDFPDERAWSGIRSAREAARELIEFGEANLFWNWRKPWLLRWRRGIRGLEYGTLQVCLDFMADLKDRMPPGTRAGDWGKRTESLDAATGEFCVRAKRLLLEEMVAAQAGAVTKLGKVNEKVDAQRKELFGSRMNHGGMCGALFDLVDSLLFDLISLSGLQESRTQTDCLLRSP